MNPPPGSEVTVGQPSRSTTMPAEQRDAEQLDAEQRDAEQRDAEQRDAEELDAEELDAGQLDDQSQRESPELLAILEDYLCRLEQGTAPEPDEVIARHPELAERLRPYLDSIDFLQHAATSMSGPSAGPKDDQPGTDQPQLGDYRLIREIGRGGMGVVYEAVQESLGRRVALKVLPLSAVLDRRQLRRFRNEAQAAAGLHHPNIVPVHGFGHDRGQHYYAMQFIEGPTLADLIRRLRGDESLTVCGGDGEPTRGEESEITGREESEAPTDGPHPPTQPPPASGSTVGPCAFDADTTDMADAPDLADSALAISRAIDSAAFYRHVAQLVLQVAEALDHAHSEGVLHRDIKPSNLILDREGKVWVTDFGLARVEALPSLTVTGDLVGTLRYMSPEQFSAKSTAVDHRSDIYSLGATLYEILTLRPAFAASNRQALLRRVACEDPAAPRRVDRAIPRELETIVMTAMAKSPHERYSSAEAMAEDLRRFLDDRPILARRPTLLQYLSKWSRRHRAVVTTATLTTILALAVSTGLLVYAQSRTSTARWEAEQHLIMARNAAARERYQRWLAEQQRTRAERNLEKAFDAVDQLLTEVAESDLAHVPQMDNVRRALLTKALNFYQQFLRENPGDDDVRQETARAYQRKANVLSMLGQPDEARESYYHAIAHFTQLGPRNPTICHDLSRTYSNLGLLLQSVGEFKEARAAFQLALEKQEELVDDFPEHPELRFTLGGILVNLANLNTTVGDLQAALKAYERALAVHEKLVEQQPKTPAFHDHLARNLQNLSFLYRELGDDNQAETLLRRALSVRLELQKSHGSTEELQSGLALCYNGLGLHLHERERHQEAEKLWRKAANIRAQLVADHPNVPQYRNDLAASYHNLGILYKNTDRLPAAIEEFENALRVREAVTRSNPGITRFQRDLALGLHSLGNAYLEADLHEQAQQSFDRAFEIQNGLIESYPSVTAYPVDLASTQLGLALLALKSNDAPLAQQRYDAVRKLVRQILKRFPNDPRAQRFLRIAEEGYQQSSNH